MHIDFTGCAGNVAAGKYNDGSGEADLLASIARLERNGLESVKEVARPSELNSSSSSSSESSSMLEEED